MQLVDNNTFLQQLGALFESTKDKGTIWLTYKRLTHDGDDTVMKEEDGSDGSREYPCIVRVTDGKKAKFSTKILSVDLDKFHSAYGALLKSSMTTLRKRDKKREKQRAEQFAKRKQRMADPVVIDGPKRGNGRRKRQRQVKAALKHADMKERAAKREEARTKQ
ncbi:signal recognition particle, SRP9/SRP14 subunit [Suillus discolor]|uniref:Signal recognition particle subunit SRP14 n=1 Tax=Suillus discolor TaxID=1912936 RepID=A0A9P7F4L6_9AGAM|nr:signal recognition particle, SRP9/SRP14 subunit [Suillus discolor]KAG2106966.1 signal recognition particle, SRP9/SRP14 subunit [Suillus discolor]